MRDSRRYQGSALPPGFASMPHLLLRTAARSSSSCSQLPRAAVGLLQQHGWPAQAHAVLRRWVKPADRASADSGISLVQALADAGAAGAYVVKAAAGVEADAWQVMARRHSSLQPSFSTSAHHTADAGGAQRAAAAVALRLVEEMHKASDGAAMFVSSSQAGCLLRRHSADAASWPPPPALHQRPHTPGPGELQ